MTQFTVPDLVNLFAILGSVGTILAGFSVRAVYRCGDGTTAWRGKKTASQIEVAPSIITCDNPGW